MKSADTLEKVAIAKQREGVWNLKKLRHWQRRIWKARENEGLNR